MNYSRLKETKESGKLNVIRDLLFDHRLKIKLKRHYLNNREIFIWSIYGIIKFIKLLLIFLSE